MRAAVIAMALGAVAGPWCRPRTAEGTEKPPAKPCLAQLHLTRAANPLRQWLAAHADGDSTPVVPALDLAAEGYQPIAQLKAYTAGGKPLMGAREGATAVAVDSAVFTPLRRADATRVDTSGVQNVGSVRDLAGAGIAPRQIVLFLLESHVIAAYWHMEATLCLADESDTDEAYAARFTGTHRYYTNEAHEDPLEFVVRIDKASGLITVQAPQAAK